MIRPMRPSKESVVDSRIAKLWEDLMVFDHG